MARNYFRNGRTIIFGDADAEPLLGLTDLEADRLKKLPAVRFKKASIE